MTIPSSSLKLNYWGKEYHTSLSQLDPCVGQRIVPQMLPLSNVSDFSTPSYIWCGWMFVSPGPLPKPENPMKLKKKKGTFNWADFATFQDSFWFHYFSLGDVFFLFLSFLHKKSHMYLPFSPRQVGSFLPWMSLVSVLLVRTRPSRVRIIPRPVK